MGPKKDTRKPCEDTESEILKAMNDLKKDILADSDAKNDELLEKIGDLDTKLSNTLTHHGERLTNLEAFQDTTIQNISDIKVDLNNVREDLDLLTKKLQDNVAHSRRLNLDFLGFKEESDFANRRDEEVIPKLREFWHNILQIPEHVAQNILVRDSHRIGKYDASAKYPRVIKCGFVLMADRNLIMSKAYRCKDTDHAIRIDLCKELVPIQQLNLKIRSDIKAANPNALASCVIRNYKPVLLVRWRNKIQEFDPKKMKFEDLQPGDRR